ncbi:MAG: 2-C-methyl-D-erythritol 2,4-cyclodiphosphate synthase [Candidatus Omnitrophica bacterium]|nr:2-C-methyl-D-erythritol 2,4-cyclodiphosphate synthase [Candidatus Omnitrophota bacterium]
MRIGYGYDIHQLVENRKLILGGVEIPCSLGLLGHSDADVLLHAISDGLLGAAGLGDIGEYFPDTDPKYKNSDSAELLGIVHQKIQAAGYVIINLDCTIFCQIIKINPVKLEIKKNISRILGIDIQAVNIKAKTMENLDAIGQNKAIAAACVVLIQK